MSFPFAIPLSDEQTREEHSTQRHPLGARGVTVDGRAFRYCKNGATAGVIGLVASSANPGPWATATDNQLAVAATVGATQVVLNDVPTGSVTKDYYKDGWLYINSTAGTQMLRIKSHAALASGTGGSTGEADAPLNLHPATPVRSAISTNATNMPRLQANPYMAVIPMPIPAAGVSNFPVGVYVTAMTAAYYGWIQTWGPCVVRIGDRVVGATVTRGLAVYNACAASTGGVQPPSTDWLFTDTSTSVLNQSGLTSPIGYTLSDMKAANFWCILFLTLAP